MASVANGARVASGAGKVASLHGRGGAGRLGAGAFLYEVWIQLRRYGAAVLGVLAVLLACDIAAVAGRSKPVVGPIAGIVRMLGWCFLVCFMGYELYRYANGGDDYSLLTLPGGRRMGLGVKVAAFAVVLLVVTLAEFPFFVSGLVRGGLAGGLLVKVSCFDLASRLLGIAAFLVMFCVIVQLAAALRSALAALAFALAAYAGLTMAQGCAVIMPLMRAHAGLQFTIGVADSDFAGVSQFVNILPVVVLDPSAGHAAMAEETMLVSVLAVNAVLLVAFSLVWRLVCPKVRVNWLK